MKISNLATINVTAAWYYFCCCYQKQQISCAIRLVATHVTIQPFLAICKATFRTSVAQCSAVKISEGALYGHTKARDFTCKERTLPGVLAAGGGTSDFAQCTQCLLMTKWRNFTVYIYDSQTGNRSSLVSKRTVAHHAVQYTTATNCLCMWVLCFLTICTCICHRPHAVAIFGYSNTGGVPVIEREPYKR